MIAAHEPRMGFSGAFEAERDISPVVLVGDCRELMAAMAAESIDAIVTDPPYELGFMAKAWDASGVAFDPETWAAALRVLKPGGHLLAFGGTRRFHRMAVAIEDAGFEIRDCLSWLYGSGFPKSLDVSKALDKAAGAERPLEWIARGVKRNDASAVYMGTGGARCPVCGKSRNETSCTCDLPTPATDLAKQWAGWGTALKPAWEPVILARKPLAGTVAANVAAHGTGGLNIDACRIASDDALVRPAIARDDNKVFGVGLGAGVQAEPGGRWPANVALDEAAAALLDEQSGVSSSGNRTRHDGDATHKRPGDNGIYGSFGRKVHSGEYGDTGGASRFYYVAKASRAERNAGLEGMPEHEARPLGLSNWAGQTNGSGETMGPSAPQANNHPTVKPIALMRWLIRMVTPPGGRVLDPFTGSGSTGCAAALEGVAFTGCELSAEYAEIARRRIAHWAAVAEREQPAAIDDLPLFAKDTADG